MHKTLLWILVGLLSLTTRVHAESPDGYEFLAWVDKEQINGPSRIR